MPLMPLDIEIARSQCTFDPNVPGEILLPKKERQLRRKILNILAKEVLFDKAIRPHLNHLQLTRRALLITKRLLELRTEHNWNTEEWQIAIALLGEHIPITLHESGFVNVIKSQGTDEQQKEWLHKFCRYELIGCYAQTEIAHGSDIQGLMTTATFDPHKDEFTIDSNGLQGIKWWCGALGVLATHSLVQAILRIPSAGDPTKFNTYGPHLFIVPIRSSDNHLPLPGVEVGNIGPKSYGGFGSVDNGYAKFTRVQIPRKNMLMRFSQVTAGGQYVPAIHDKLSYGSMVAIRAGLPGTIGWVLAKAITTAVRYTTVRRQFRNSTLSTSEQQEIQVIKYAAVKYRLFPILAQSYAYIIVGRRLWELYLKLLDGLMRGNATMLREIHSLSSALKALTTWDGTTSIEEARKAMGGHGFSALSGVGHLFAEFVSAQTYEGDNYVIAQQTARILLKHMTKSDLHSLPPSSQYIRFAVLPESKSFNIVSNMQAWKTSQTQIKVLEHRAATILSNFAISITSEKRPWADCSFEAAKLTRAHAELFIVREFWKIAGEDPVLSRLAQLYGISVITSSLVDIVEAQLITAAQIKEVRRIQAEIIESFSIPDVIGLTDAFGFDDWELGILGRADGNVYEKLWDEVRSEELEQQRSEMMKMYSEGGWKGLRKDVMNIRAHWIEEQRRWRANI